MSNQRVWLSLGSNLGDRLGYLNSALNALSERALQLDDVSGLYETDPVGEVEQDNFLNIVISGLTSLEPLALLDECQRIEATHKRQRLLHWGPRTLDIDLLLMGQDFNDDRLTLPHPEMLKREFVLRPMADLDHRPNLPVPYPTGPSNEVRLLQTKGWHQQ